jgi:hypothetical protein
MYAKDKTTIIDRREMLRVKLKSLAAEAKIIRREEQRTHGVLRNELHTHRQQLIRRASREAHLAYGFIRGRTLVQMETTSRTKPNWDAIRKMLKAYGPVGMPLPEVIAMIPEAFTRPAALVRAA